MGLDINSVAKALGISKKSAKALDALDGKSDKQVQESIYDQAAELLNAARTGKGNPDAFNFDFRVDVYNAIEDDIKSIMGYVKTDSKKTNYEEKINTNIKSEDTSKYSTKMNDTWAGIVQKFYPDLLESCDGKMFGANGAVRKLKEALCTDATGKVDTAKLKYIMQAADLPKQIKLPDEINGTKLNKELVNKAAGEGGILNREKIISTITSEQ